MCLLTVILSWSSFSQTVTEIKDTCHVVLSTDVARKVAVDLLEGDAAKEQTSLLEEEVAALESTIAIQQKQIYFQEEQNTAQNELLEIYRIQAVQNTQDIEQLNRSLKRASTRGTIFATTTGIAVVGLVCALIFGGK